MFKICYIFFISLIAVFNLNGQIDKSNLFKRMEATVNSIKTLQFTIENTERIDGKLLSGKQFVKITKTPFSCYAKIIKGTNPEIYYKTGENNGDMIYCPNGFPYVNINIDPHGSIARRNNHQTIFELGFDYFANILQDLWKTQPGSFELFDENNSFYTLKYLNPAYKIETITVAKTIGMSTLANNLKVDDYKLKELNPQLTYGNIEAGKIIKAPNTYGKRIDIYISKENFLPLHIRVFDEKGLYEEYRYTNLIINPLFKGNELKRG